jgi:hypothetical protein
MKKYGLLLLVLLPLLTVAPAWAAERVWVHCDRSLYAAGETIWLRGWVTDPDGEAATSKFLYVELLRDGLGSVEQRIKLKERGGMFFGQMELPDDMDSGWYTLRAYTRAQKDWPAEALFHTRLLIRGAGAVPGLTTGIANSEADASDVRVNLSLADNGHLAVSLTDAAGKPVVGNFSLSVVRSQYADYDYQPAPSMTASYIALPGGEREYTQEVVFRVKSVRNRLPDKYGVAIMSQDIGYYFSTDVAGDRSVKGEEGQSFRIPELDFPEGTLFTINTTGSKFISPAEEDESLAFAAPFDYGPTYPEREVIRDTVVIRERFEGTVAPLPADDTITASKITAERKAPWYKHPRMVGPYSHLFEWRQVRLREDMEKYDDMDLLTYIHMNFPSLQIGRGTKGRYLYTTRGASIQRKTGSHHNVSLYIDGLELNDGWTEIQILSVRDVQNLFVLRGPEAALYNSNAVVLLEMRRFDEKMIEEQRKNERKTTIGIIPLGWQKPKSFDASPAYNPDRQGTYYWSPCIRTDAAGHADIYLPELPDSYYLRLEGQTLDGRWFSSKGSFAW